MTDVCFLYATAPDAKTARAIARALVERRLAACVNVIPGMTSLYRWKGAIESAEEIVIIVKTTADAALSAKDLICELHPSQTPCVVALCVSAAASNSDFLDWIAKEASGRPDDA